MRIENMKTLFFMGEANDAYAQYFAGQSYLNMLTTNGVPIGNVTFEPVDDDSYNRLK